MYIPEPVHVFNQDADIMNSAMSPNFKLLAIAAGSDKIQIIDIDKKEVIKELKGCCCPSNNVVIDMCFS